MSKPEQPAEQGAGPLIERRYYVDVAQAKHTPEALMRTIQCDLERFSPDLLADFEKVKGEEHCLQPNDEFKIRILGPWNGTVRVSAVGKSFFELVTLEGHPEAGRIRFSAQRLPRKDNVLRFAIHSWARSRDGLVGFTYNTLGVGKRVQQQTWETFCQRAAEASGGEPLGAVHVKTIEHKADQTKVKRDA